MYKGEKRGGQAVSPLGSEILLHVECFFTCWFCCIHSINFVSYDLSFSMRMT